MSAALQLVDQNTPIEVISGAAVLDEVTAFISRYSAFPSRHCAPMLALWYAHTHVAEHLYVTPRLILSSAEPGSGKTRVLEVAQFLVARPKMTLSITPAAIFRLLADGPMTLLFDEIDAIFNSKSGGNHEDLRALLNSGYKRTATVSRCVGDARSMKVADFPVYAPVALAGIAGGMPDTLTSRAITVHMRRARADEHVDEFWEEDVEAEAAPIRERLAAWAATVTEQAATGRPPMPNGVRNRQAEIWRPLLALGHAAGEHWPQRAAAACQHFTGTGDAHSGSVGIRLLNDLHTLFTGHGVDRMTTVDIVAALIADEEASWADIDGKPIDGRRIAAELRRYEIGPRDIKLPSGKVLKGYYATGAAGLADAWSRYLAPAATAATAATAQVRPVADEIEVALPAATPLFEVAGGSGTEKSSATGLTCAVAAVAAVADTSRGTR